MLNTQILREIDRRISDMRQDFELHRQAIQFQIKELGDRIKPLESRKEKSPWLLDFITNPKVLKILGGSAIWAAGYVFSRLTG